MRLLKLMMWSSVCVALVLSLVLWAGKRIGRQTGKEVGENLNGQAPTQSVLASEDGFKPLTVVKGVGRGEVKRTVEGEKVEITLVANLETLKRGFYGVSLVSGNESRMIGRLTEGKGGLFLEYTGGLELLNYDRIVVSLEITDDGVIEETILEGSLK